MPTNKKRAVAHVAVDRAAMKAAKPARNGTETETKQMTKPMEYAKPGKSKPAKSAKSAKAGAKARC